MLVDSNILIYATKPEHARLRQWLIETLPKASAISKVEILGYHKLNSAEKVALTELLNSLELIYLTPSATKSLSNYASNANSRSAMPSSPLPALKGDISWRHAILAISPGLTNCKHSILWKSVEIKRRCERLIEWMAIEKDEKGLVLAPYDEIVVDMKLPERRAA